MQPIKFILSGGGTGGHIFPAVSIANELKKKYPQAEFLFVGALGRMEMEKVPNAGYKIIGLPITGIQRKLTFSNFLFPFRLIKSILKAQQIIKEFKPSAVIGTGGFASGPTLRAAVRLGIPSLIQEQNSYAGITNKWLAKKVNKICVAYPNMETFFPKEKIVFTGNPVRQDISDLDSKKTEGYAFFNLSPDKPIILVIGGSLGALSINTGINESIEHFAKQNIQLIWQTGKGYYPKAKTAVTPYENKGIHAFDFIQRMDFAYAVADIVISRAGASSVSELCNTAKPCILIPSPNVAEDHQTKNAMALVNKDAALFIRDNEVPGNLYKQAIQLCHDEQKKKELSDNISKLAVHNSSELIVNEISKLIKP